MKEFLLTFFDFDYLRVYDHQNSPHEWSDFMHQSKRSHIMINSSTANGHLFTNYTSLFDYSTAPAGHLETFTNILDKVTESHSIITLNEFVKSMRTQSNNMYNFDF